MNYYDEFARNIKTFNFKVNEEIKPVNIINSPLAASHEHNGNN